MTRENESVVREAHRRFRRGMAPIAVRLVLATVLLLAALGAYWQHLLVEHRAQLEATEARVQGRAEQLADAMAQQADALMGDVEFIADMLSSAWLLDDVVGFREVQQLLLRRLPVTAVTGIAVIDAGGRVVYSDPAGMFHGEDFAMEVFVAAGDASAGMPVLAVGEPKPLGAERQWSVPFSMPIMRGGESVGAVVVWLASDYMVKSFRSIFSGGRDAASLVRNDGVFLARSSRFDEVVGSTAREQTFMRQPESVRSGTARRVSALDGVERMYAFRRVDGHPLTVNVGLELATEFQPVFEAHEGAVRASVVAAVFLVLTAAVVGWSFLQRERSGLALALSQERLELALAGGELGTWDWDVLSGRTRFNERLALMLGYGLDEVAPNVESWEKRLHPDDREAVMLLLQRHLDGRSDHYESEHRMLHRDGHWVWVLDRGRVVERAADGAPKRMVGTHLDVTSRKLAEAVVSEAHERLERLVRNVPGMVYQYLRRPDGSSSFPYASAGVVSVYGISVEEAAQSADKVFAIIHPDDLAQVMDSTRESERTLTQWRCEYRVRDPDGSVRWLLGQANPQQLEDGATLWHGYIYDVTEQHVAAAELEAGRVRMETLLERVPVGVLMEGEGGAVVIANASFCTLVGLPPQPAALMGMPHAELVARLGAERGAWLFSPDEHDRRAGAHSIEVAGGNGKVLEFEWLPMRRDGARVGQAWLVRDITVRKQREAELESLASTDALTGLPNRRTFMARLEAAVADARELPEGAGGAVLMFDIDHFKRVNDTWGHAVGDVVLQHVSGIIRDCLRQGDVSGRLGGEEFAALLPGASVENARLLAERVRERIEASPAVGPSGEIRVTISIGVAPFDGQDPGRVLERADEALYEAKGSGRNRVCVAA